MPGDGNVDRFNQRQGGGDRQRLRRGIAGSELNQRASVEIALDGDPGPALASPSRFLVKRNQPITFDCAAIGDQVGIGRTGPLDDPDARQNKDSAALSEYDWRKPIRT